MLRETARAADAIVVPTAAMADRLIKLAPRSSAARSHTSPGAFPTTCSPRHHDGRAALRPVICVCSTQDA